MSGRTVVHVKGMGQDPWGRQGLQGSARPGEVRNFIIGVELLWKETAARISEAQEGHLGWSNSRGGGARDPRCAVWIRAQWDHKERMCDQARKGLWD